MRFLGKDVLECPRPTFRLDCGSPNVDNWIGRAPTPGGTAHDSPRTIRILRTLSLFAAVFFALCPFLLWAADSITIVIDGV